MKTGKCILIISFTILIIAFAIGCGYKGNRPDLIKTANEATITFTEYQQESYKSPGTGGPGDKKMMADPVVETTPYYYIAILNEASDNENSRQEIEDNYPYLIEMVETADDFNIKLTLMFSVEWAKYISGDNFRLAMLKEWVINGHEAACCHLGLYSDDWDGYTDLHPDKAARIRQQFTADETKYAGTMDDFINEVKKINDNLKSGFIKNTQENFNLNNADKYVINDEIIYYTIPGFSGLKDSVNDENSGNFMPGLNEDVPSAEINGIERKMLGHLQLNSRETLNIALKTVQSANSNYIYGAAISGSREMVKFYTPFLEYLHFLDPEGLNSRTLMQAAEEKLIPESFLKSAE